MRRVQILATMIALTFVLTGMSGCADKPAEKKEEPKKETPKEEKKAEKAPEVKPAEVKPAEVKPAEEKPAEVKPVEEKPAEKPAEEKPAEVKPEEKPAEEKPVEIVKDPAIEAEVAKVAACTAEMYDNYKCDALDTVTNLLRDEGQKKERALPILATVGELVFSDQPATAMAAAYLVAKLNHLSVLHTLSQEAGVVTKAQADRYIQILSLKTLPPRVLSEVAAVATKVATLGGQTEALLAALAQITEPAIVASVIPALMVFGRLAAFPKIQEMVKGTDVTMRQRAIQAPANMYKWTPEESAVICPWAEPMLGDADEEFASIVGNLMVNCRQLEKGKYIDSLLAEGKKRVEAGTWKLPFAFAYRDVCFGGMMGEADKPDPEVCKKTYEFLEWATNYEKLDPKMRGMALGFIYYQARNADTMKILRKYENSPVEEIKKRAQESIKSLEERGIK